jgi:pimeloyl-ACP methyl ester carboxylesterase
VRVQEHTITIDHAPVFYRSAGAPEPTILYLHGAPTSSEDWVPFLERTGGVAPDLIGFGRSGKGGHLDYSPEGLTEFVARFLAELGVDRFKLVGHGWGAVIALLLAARQPAGVERLVLIDGVPLSEGFAWSGAPRLWRRGLVGELVMGSTSRRMFARELRKGTVRPEAWTPERLDALWGQFDQGTQRALLRLHRSADERRLAALGSALGELTVPALVVWGDRDPWFPAGFAEAYGTRLSDATVRHVPEAGHWPWLDQPDVVDLVAEFVTAP